MGVHGLWDLLAPVGRRVSVEALSGKILAIDASIWMIQFMKAMRDDKGEMVRNAHILGFFRRICKLLYLKTKPVFVFDGGTPALKRRTVIARRRQRENAQAKVRKMAEKLLLNQIKAIKLKELKTELENQRRSNVKRKKNKSDQIENNLMPGNRIHEMPSGSSKTVSGREYLGNEPSSSTGADKIDSEANGDKNELDLRMNRNKDKGKEILVDSTDNSNAFSHKGESAGSKLSQIELDEMLAASLAAEHSKETSSASSNLFNNKVDGLDENESEEEELVLPMHGKVDTSILASLPPSVQLDLLGQMRERLMAENRQRYQAVKKEPEKFSELQIQSYLKTVAFRKEIDEVQKNSAGKVADGVKTSRIASEANREFIFSSSYSGDKRFIAPTEVPSSSDRNNASPELNTNANQFVVKGKKKTDQRRFMKANRMKAMGIRMTRDLQRNLDMMKEYEMDLLQNRASGVSSSDNVSKQVSGGGNEQETFGEECSVHISFDAEEDKGFCSEDELFKRLVSGSVNDENLKESSSESDWEDGNVYEHSKDHANIVSEINMRDSSDVEWEDGDYESPTSFPQKVPSRGDLEEDANLQKAIEESLDDLRTNNDEREVGIEGGMVEEEEQYMSTEPVETSLNAKILIAEKEGEENTLSRVLEDNSYECINASESLLAKSDGEDDADFQNAIKISLEDVVIKNDPIEVIAEDPMEYKNSGKNEVRDVSINGESYVAEEIYGKLQNETPHPKLGDCSREKNEAASSSIKAKFIELTPKIPDPPTVIREEEATTSDYISSELGNEETENFDVEEELRIVEEEYKNMGKEQRRLERNADSVNSEMFAECQELLQMFGLPYVIAPMEAEAQCAHMEMAGDVDGIVTDDSDVFLFGGRNVYKNIFDDRKYMETYFMKDVEKELGLSREKLIRMALLLGSDYTEGVSGVGIVNAIEIVNAFDEEDGLVKFREWIESPDPSILGMKSKSKKNASENDTSTARQVFMDKHRNVSKNWHIPPSFPSEVVVSAYTCAQVDKSTKPYSSGKPDLLVLQRLCWEKFGWDSGKSKELLQPVLAEYNKREIQLRMEAFYSFNEKFAKIRSKRIMKAVKGIAKNQDDDNDDAQPWKEAAKPTERSKKRKNAARVDEVDRSVTIGGGFCRGENDQDVPQVDDVHRSVSAGGGFCVGENDHNAPLPDPATPELLPMPYLKRKHNV